MECVHKISQIGLELHNCVSETTKKYILIINWSKYVYDSPTIQNISNPNNTKQYKSTEFYFDTQQTTALSIAMPLQLIHYFYVTYAWIFQTPSQTSLASNHDPTQRHNRCSIAANINSQLTSNHATHIECTLPELWMLCGHAHYTMVFVHILRRRSLYKNLGPCIPHTIKIN